MAVAFENDHNVYVLGAGFSVPSGIPSVVPFLSRMREAAPELASRGFERERGAVLKVLEFRQSAASAAFRTPINVENIEELFSLADAMSNKGIAKEVTFAIAGTIEYAASTSKEPYVQFTAPSADHPVPPNWKYRNGTPKCSVPLYDAMVAVMTGWRSGNESKNTFLSFNYDLLVEQALEHLKLPYSYSLGSGSANYDESAACVHAPNAQGIEVLKLHGSMNWGMRPPSSGTKGGGRRFTVYGDYRALRRADASPVLVPPTWRKQFSQQLANVWDRAVEAVRTATRVIVVGFSMPQADQHFKYLLAAGLKENISLREVLLVNPNAEDLTARAAELFRIEQDFEAVSLRAHEFIGSESWRERIRRDLGGPWLVKLFEPQQGA